MNQIGPTKRTIRRALSCFCPLCSISFDTPEDYKRHTEQQHRSKRTRIANENASTSAGPVLTEILPDAVADENESDELLKQFVFTFVQLKNYYRVPEDALRMVLYLAQRVSSVTASTIQNHIERDLARLRGAPDEFRNIESASRYLDKSVKANVRS